MSPIQDHPLRYQLANELHARPFPALQAPCRAVYLAIKKAQDAASRDRSGDLQHLLALLDRYGTAHPQPGATHFSAAIGQHMLKWEQHTEFVTYTVFLDGLGERPYDPADFDVFPGDWLEAAMVSRYSSEQYQNAKLELISRLVVDADELLLMMKELGWAVPVLACTPSRVPS